MPSHAKVLLRRLHTLTAPPASDAVLLARWRERRDEAAFAALVARHGPMVLGVCRRVLGDMHHAEDAFQATFFVLARKAAAVRRPESLAGFLYHVALRLARKARGAARRRTVLLPPDALAPADPRPHPLDVLSGQETLVLLDEEINRLPEIYRLPFLLCVLQERSVEEAARLLGRSPGSVRGRLARARQRLRERLTRRGLDLSLGMVALLAPVAVPERLSAGTLRGLAVSPAAESVLRAGSAHPLRPKMACLVLLLAAGLGVSLPYFGATGPEPLSTTTPPRAAKAEDEPRRDRAGDPLPPGAVARLGTLRFRAPDAIGALAFAPDGKTIAAYTHYGPSKGRVGGGDAIADFSGYGVLLFDAASGKRTQRLPTADAWWWTESPLAFSPDGKRLAGRERISITKDVVRVWELAGERKPRDYDAEHAIWLGWSAGGEPLAVCQEDGALRLRELVSNRSRRFECIDLEKPDLRRYDSVPCACSPNGHALAVADQQGRAHVWDSATGRERCTVKPRGDALLSLALSPDGRTLASLTREVAQLWDARTGKALHTVGTGQKYLTSVAFTPDGKALATVGWSDVIFWDVTTGRERGRTQAKEYTFAASVAFSPDGKTMAASERNAGTIHLWDVATGRPKPQAAGLRGWPVGTTVSSDGRRLASGDFLDGTLHVWDMKTGASLVLVQRADWVKHFAFSPDGRSLYSLGTGDELWVSDATTGERRHAIKLDEPDRQDTKRTATVLRVSEDGKTLVALGYYYPKKSPGGPESEEVLITGWDSVKRTQLFQRWRSGMDGWTTLSADGRVFAVPDVDRSAKRERGPGEGAVRLEDVRSGETLLTFPALEGQTWPLRFSPDGRWQAVNNHPPRGEGDTLRVWETATAAEVLVLPTGEKNCPAFSADSRLLAVAAPSREILVWDLVLGREHGRFKGFGATVTSLAFSPDGRRLVSGLTDSTLLVWGVRPRRNAPEPRPGAEGLAKAWADLAGTDAVRALRARGVLASAPEEAVVLLDDRLRAAKAVDVQRLPRLLADLGSNRFTMRQKAQASLEEMGDLAVPALRQALTDKSTLEVRKRVQDALERVRGPVTRPELLRSLRALAVLEDIGTPAAHKVLERLAAGAPEARLTQEAKASLERLARQRR
jgi:RNA polymerase sigma factor (sigma-70 family)